MGWYRYLANSFDFDFELLLIFCFLSSEIVSSVLKLFLIYQKRGEILVKFPCFLVILLDNAFRKNFQIF
ncbi:Uncharacterized protein TCM_036454 [Theobroma cacao]|uniref:Uncharacterized protein n=1 Tax=Theobroma cacao TaxID=3641 RepID=A0A061FJQ0_THECC|nr:Uncharacterized protein TCM_036454 [Theobroma cacao]